MVKRHLGQAYWRKIVSDYESSQLSQRAFAEQRALPYYTFRGWIHRIRNEKRESASSFVDVGRTLVPVSSSNQSSGPRITVETPQGLRCIIEGTPSSATLHMVITELSRGPR